MIAPTAYPVSGYPSSRVEWLWEPFLARGKLSILDGDPGVGKSLLAVDLAARLSRGGPLPDGAPVGRPHVTLLLNAEDSVHDTIRPRAEAAGADLDRLLIGIGGHDQPLRLLDECMPLVRMICEHRADLLVIDPVMAFLPPEVAADADRCAGCCADPLAALAARTRLCGAAGAAPAEVGRVEGGVPGAGERRDHRGVPDGASGGASPGRPGAAGAGDDQDEPRPAGAVAGLPADGGRGGPDGGGVDRPVGRVGRRPVRAIAGSAASAGPGVGLAAAELSGGPRKAAELLATAAEPASRRRRYGGRSRT